MRRILSSRNLGVALCVFLAVGCSATKTTTKPAATAKPAASPAPKPVILYVTSDKVNLRACPSLECKVVAVLPLGDEVIKLGQKDDWIHIRVKATKREGWAATRLVGKSLQKKTPPRIMEEKTPRGKQTQRSPELQEEFAP
ncbi:MAG TPA: SH3 domain-containing protein [Deltaproteobacteria bacterium]|nr:SH3 domain-containing protein [Deltaproteobacteria bacterium]